MLMRHIVPTGDWNEDFQIGAAGFDEAARSADDYIHLACLVDDLSRLDCGAAVKAGFVYRMCEVAMSSVRDEVVK